jgi:hypothetical protein
LVARLKTDRAVGRTIDEVVAATSVATSKMSFCRGILSGEV